MDRKKHAKSLQKEEHGAANVCTKKTNWVLAFSLDVCRCTGALKTPEKKQQKPEKTEKGNDHRRKKSNVGDEGFSGHVPADGGASTPRLDPRLHRPPITPTLGGVPLRSF